MPGSAAGTATRLKRARRPWPSEAATSSSAGSTAAKAARAAMIRNGAATNVCASTIPMRVSVSVPSNSRPAAV